MTHGVVLGDSVFDNGPCVRRARPLPARGGSQPL